MKDCGGLLSQSSYWAWRGAWHKHHLLPRVFVDKFENCGIENIDRYVMKIPDWAHRYLHRGGFGWRGGYWNSRWAQFFKTHTNPSMAEVIKFLKNLMREAGINDLPIVGQ